MPSVGLGTWKSRPGEVGAAVTEALKAGYRHIDCAAIYGNESEVGDALQAAFAGTVQRKDVFITGKLWNNSHAPGKVVSACKQTLSDLKISYLDLFLVHWPVCQGEEIPMEETWKAMEGLVDAGLVRNIGVSNWTVKKLEKILACARIAPAVNQVEMHPLLPQVALREFCKAHGIVVTAYSSLGTADSPFKPADFPSLLAHPTIVSIASKHGKTPAQVLLRWVLAMGAIVLPKSTHAHRIKENLDCRGFTLDAADMEAISRMDQHRRSAGQLFWEGRMTEAQFWDNE